MILYAVYSSLLRLSYRCVEGGPGPIYARRTTFAYYWVQRLGPLATGLLAVRARLAVADETQVRIGGERWRLWIEIDPANRAILAMRTSAHGNAFNARLFLGTKMLNDGKFMSNNVELEAP